MPEPIAFSVIIPLYNKASTVLRAIESVRTQTLQPLEVLVVNNNSTDAGEQLVAGFGWEKVRLLHEPAAGVSQARNAGIAAAQGSHLAFLDADDHWETGFLEHVAGLVHRHLEAGWYATGYVFRFADGDRLPVHPGLEKFEAGLLKNYFEVVARGDMVATASSVCIPKVVLDELGGFPVNEKIGEDQDLWARIALRYPVAFDPQPLAVYEQEAEGMATRAQVARELWPFIGRLAALAPQHPTAIRQPLKRYLSRQLVGQASQLVLDGAFTEARQLLAHPLARLSGLRYGYWLLRAYIRR